MAVRLDPWQNIVGVGWNSDRFVSFTVGLSSTNITGFVEEPCFGPPNPPPDGQGNSTGFMTSVTLNQSIFADRFKWSRESRNWLPVTSDVVSVAAPGAIVATYGRFEVPPSVLNHIPTGGTWPTGSTRAVNYVPASAGGFTRGGVYPPGLPSEEYEEMPGAVQAQWWSQVWSSGEICSGNAFEGEPGLVVRRLTLVSGQANILSSDALPVEITFKETPSSPSEPCEIVAAYTAPLSRDLYAASTYVQTGEFPTSINILARVTR